ncbi:MAG: aminotransferase class I/II-fold pyridoxal phosphate-dependent enzyme [Christensenellaceae bacterium]|jgi:histidinol-phosphate aminotransferase|nr:aminotransferase class I/II-fold pyridoxal phosphate-dependent enzyme [Christensenellaceae bacterium]
MPDFESLIKPALLAMPLFRPSAAAADVMKKYNLSSVTKLSMNENQYGPSPRAIEAMIGEAKSHAFQYPDRQGELLRAIAQKHGVTPQGLAISAGASGILNAIGDTFILPGDEVILSSMPYQQYPMVVARNDGKIVTIPVREDLRQDLDATLAAIGGKTKLIMLCNPGNPSSVAENTAELEAFIQKVPERVILMVDEAYLDFATDPERKKSMIPNIERHPNLIVVRTFSKLYGLAGLRIGYGVSSPELIACLSRGGALSSVNRLAMAAAIAALEDESYQRFIYDSITEDREMLAERFRGYGWAVYPSSTNFLYFKTGLDAGALLEALQARGILIRNFEFNRISVGTREQNRALLGALDEILHSGALNRAARSA